MHFGETRHFLEPLRLQLSPTRLESKIRYLALKGLSQFVIWRNFIRGGSIIQTNNNYSQIRGSENFLIRLPLQECDVHIHLP